MGPWWRVLPRHRESRLDWTNGGFRCVLRPFRPRWAVYGCAVVLSASLVSVGLTHDRLCARLREMRGLEGVGYDERVRRALEGFGYPPR